MSLAGELTFSELKSKLSVNLKENSIGQKLKAQLRHFLIQRIQSNTPNVPTKTLLLKAIDSLIIEYLRNNNNDYTLSVFFPESGLDHYSNVMEDDDILETLHLKSTSHHSKLYSHIREGQANDLLTRILKGVGTYSDYFHNLEHVGIQTEDFGHVGDSLDLKMKEMDSIFKFKRSKNEKRDDEEVEDRIVAFQKRLETIMKIDMEQQLQKFKDLELAQLRLEERKSYQNHIARLKSDYDQKILDMQQEMLFMEEKEGKRWATREHELEMANMEMRQKLLDESNRMALKEATLRNTIELESKEIIMERDLLSRKYKEAEDKIKELTEFKEKYALQMQESMAQYKIDLNREHASLLSSVEIERTKLQGERALLSERAAVTEQMMNNVKQAQTDIDNIRNNLRDTQIQLQKAIKEKDDAQLHVKELQLKLLTNKGSSAVEFELQSLKAQLLEAEQLNQKRQKEYQIILERFAYPVEPAKSANMKSDTQWQTECERLTKKLAEEASKTNELQNKYDQEVLKCKQLRKDLADLQLLLHQARSALNKEIALKSTMERYPNHLFRTDMLPDPLDIRYEDQYRASSRKVNDVFRRIPDPYVANRENHNVSIDEDESHILSRIEPIDLRSVSPLKDQPDVHKNLLNHDLLDFGPLKESINNENPPEPRLLECNEDSLAEKEPHVIVENAVSNRNLDITAPMSSSSDFNSNVQKEDQQSLLKFADSKETQAINNDIQNLIVVPICENVIDIKDIPNVQDECLLKETNLVPQEDLCEKNSEPVAIRTEENEPKEKETVLSKLDMLEKDPILQKYMDLISEKRKENTSMIIDSDARVESFTAKLEVCFVLVNQSLPVLIYLAFLLRRETIGVFPPVSQVKVFDGRVFMFEGWGRVVRNKFEKKMVSAVSNYSMMLQFSGHEFLRQRLILSALSGKSIRINNIRDSDDQLGLLDYEASFLRLLDKITNGSSIEINYTGTCITFVPGVLSGGKIHHDCPPSRSIGYFLEAVIALAPFCKNALILSLTGITNDNLDPSMDTIRTVTLPQLKRFGIEGAQLKITKRGAPPLGGGQVTFSCPTVRSLKPIQFVEQGEIKRIRGIAYATRMSPQMANRVMESARSLLTRYIPDVYIYTDVYKGVESGLSPGYALSLVAESTTDAILSAECSYQPRAHLVDKQESTGSKDVLELADQVLDNNYNFPTPEDLGVRASRLLLQEIKKGGCVDAITQWLYVLFIALGPEDVGKFRIGTLSPFTIQFLRDIKTFLSVSFKIESDPSTKTIILSALGTGYKNNNKKVT